jgi:hypothetical protein
MHIDSYEFGRIVIDGIAYTSDCLILGEAVQADWWRQQGHMLLPEDIQPVVEHRPAVLVIGCGTAGRMKVHPATQEMLRQHGIQAEILDTGKAVERFNELAHDGVNVAAALHLTC